MIATKPIAASVVAKSATTPRIPQPEEWAGEDRYCYQIIEGLARFPRSEHEELTEAVEEWLDAGVDDHRLVCVIFPRGSVTKFSCEWQPGRQCWTAWGEER